MTITHFNYLKHGHILQILIQMTSHCTQDLNLMETLIGDRVLESIFA